MEVRCIMLLYTPISTIHGDIIFCRHFMGTEFFFFIITLSRMTTIRYWKRKKKKKKTITILYNISFWLYRRTSENRFSVHSSRTFKRWKCILYYIIIFSAATGKRKARANIIYVGTTPPLRWNNEFECETDVGTPERLYGYCINISYRTRERWWWKVWKNVKHWTSIYFFFIFPSCLCFRH